MTEKTMLPDVAAYLKAVDAAEYARNTERDAINKQYPFISDPAAWDTAKYRESETARSKAHQESVDRYHTAMAAALKALRESSDPLVAWVAREVQPYHEDEALALLKALPMTVEELDAFADDADWCSAYTRLRLDAQQAGVLPGLEPLSRDERALLEWVIEKADDRLSMTELRQFSSLVDSIRAEVHRSM